MKKLAALAVALAFNANAENFALQNVSIRGYVGTGDNVVILGFIVPDCYESLAVVIQGRGPSLAAAGVVGALSDPVLTVVEQATGRVIDTNDSWQNPERIEALTHRGVNLDPREAATVLSLKPGAYTAILSGANGSVGVGIVELSGGF